MNHLQTRKKKPVLLPLHPPQIPDGLAWNEPGVSRTQFDNIHHETRHTAHIVCHNEGVVKYTTRKFDSEYCTKHELDSLIYLSIKFIDIINV